MCSHTNMVRTVASVPAPMIGGELYTVCLKMPLMIGAVLMILNTAVLMIMRKRKGFNRRPLRT